NDPVGSGLVASLARPGGNITGISSDATDAAGIRGLAGKRVGLLNEVVPNLRKLAIMATAELISSQQTISDVQEAGRLLGIEVIPFEVRRAEDVVAAIDAMKDRVNALYVSSDAITFINRVRINTLAIAARLPTIWTRREVVEVGGLMSYGTSLPD